MGVTHHKCDKKKAWKSKNAYRVGVLQRRVLFLILTEELFWKKKSVISQAQRPLLTYEIIYLLSIQCLSIIQLSIIQLSLWQQSPLHVGVLTPQNRASSSWDLSPKVNTMQRKCSVSFLKCTGVSKGVFPEDYIAQQCKVSPWPFKVIVTKMFQLSSKIALHTCFLKLFFLRCLLLPSLLPLSLVDSLQRH